MPSSTSSFRGTPTPQSRPWLTLLAGLLLFLAALGGWEAYWRAQGFRPTANDDGALWAVNRARVPAMDPHAVVFGGTSRALSGLVPKVFAEETGGAQPIQLAVAGGDHWSILEEIAADEDFRGLLLVDINPVHYLYLNPTHPERANTETCIAAYHEMAASPARSVEARLGVRVQESLVSRMPALFARQLWTAWINGARPRPGMWLLDRDRYRRPNPHMAPQAWHRHQKRLVRRVPVLARRALRDIDETMRNTLLVVPIRNLIRRIEARGGRVVFLRMPVSETMYRAESRFFPRETYWDLFVAETGVPAIHFKDYPAMQGLGMADGSHLDTAAAKDFTRLLAGKLTPYL